jgi:hypothetical protein
VLEHVIYDLLRQDLFRRYEMLHRTLKLDGFFGMT